MTKNDIIIKIGRELITTGPQVPPTKIILRGSAVFSYDPDDLILGDKVYEYTLVDGTPTLTEIP